MFRLLAIPVMILSALTNNAPVTAKPVDPVKRQGVELEVEPCQGTCCVQTSVFHGGAVARFGLNKTALRPQGERKLKADYFTTVPDNEKQKGTVEILPSQKAAKAHASSAEDLVSPLTINLFF